MKLILNNGGVELVWALSCGALLCFLLHCWLFDDE